MVLPPFFCTSLIGCVCPINICQRMFFFKEKGESKTARVGNSRRSVGQDWLEWPGTDQESQLVGQLDLLEIITISF